MSVQVRDNGAQRLIQTVGRISSGVPITEVGVLGDKGSVEQDGITIAAIAEIHEFGLGVPMRSWLRAWVDEPGNQQALNEVMTRLNVQIFTNKLTFEQAARTLGIWVVGQIQTWIRDGNVQPPLSEATIAAKGSDVPLIDTGALRSAISSRVVEP